MIDKICRHLDYFVVGVLYCSMLVMASMSFMFLILFLVNIFDWKYLIVLPLFIGSMHYIGKRITNKMEQGD